MEFKFSLLIFLIAFAVLACEKDDENTPSGNETEVNGTGETELNKSKILKLVNAERAKGRMCGGTNMPAVDPLKWDDRLAKAAYDHCVDMDKHSYFSHTSKDGRRASDRIKAVGYSYATWAENIGNGYATEEAVMKGWLKSEGHCKNIMAAKIKDIGIGKKGKYWTQVFATKK